MAYCNLAAVPRRNPYAGHCNEEKIIYNFLCYHLGNTSLFWFVYISFSDLAAFHEKKMPFGIILWKLWDPGCKNLVESKIEEGYIEKIGST